MKTDKKLLTWNLSLLFNSDNAAEIEIKKIKSEQENRKFINKWNPKLENNKYRDDYLQNPQILKEAIDEFEELTHYYGTDGGEGYYFWLRSALEENNSALKAKFNKAVEFEQTIENEMQFFTIRISRIDKSLHEIFLNSVDLTVYKHFLEKLFSQAKYLLSEPEEKILNLKSKTSHYNWVKMTSGLITKEERKIEIFNKEKNKYIKVNKSFSEIMSEMDNLDKKSRDSAAGALNDILNKWIDVGENEINAVFEDKKINDNLRGVNRPDELRHLSDDIDSSSVDTLVKIVKEYEYVGKKFYELKSKLLGLPKLAYHERNLSYGQIDRYYSFDEAKKLITRAFVNLDEDFNKIFQSYIVDGRVDVYPLSGKMSGAFMMSGLKSQPNYILLNYTGRLQDVLTLAHEMGHGIHYEFAKKQNAINYGTTLSTTEVASTFMEDFVLQEIMKDADEELKLSLLMMRLNDEISTIIRQIAIYTFELDLHKDFKKKGYLSKKEIGEIFQKNMSAYMGDFVEQSKGSENWWLYISHIRNFFYVYSYASGLLISKSLQNNVKRDPKFVEKVKEFFSAGTSASPKDIFMKLGIDISQKDFWIKGLNELKNTLDEVETLAKKLGKI